MKKGQRELLRQLRSLGLEAIALEPGGKHFKLTARYKGRSIRRYVPSTPSCSHGSKNFLAEIKRDMRACMEPA